MLMRIVSVVACVLLIAAAASALEPASRTIAILGTGDVASALGPRWAEGGHCVVYGSRAPASARVEALVAATGHEARATDHAAAVTDAEVVVLAVPYRAMERLAPALGDLSGKIVIDCTNPLTRDLRDLDVADGTSGAETVADLLPGARVVKALNTVGAGVMRDAAFPEGRPTMLLAGESAMAKGVVSSLVEELGFEAVDAGPLRSARLLEPLALLWIELAYRQGLGEELAFRVMRREAAEQ